MAKSRKKTAKTARKKRPARAKRMKMSRQMIGRRKTKSTRKTARRPKRAKSKRTGIVDRLTDTVQDMVDAAKEASAMREKMGSRGGLSEG
jgi:hypothetical protein